MSVTKLIIPPRPSILLELKELMQQEDPSLDKIAYLIKYDASLFSTLLACVNSAWMGLPQKVHTVETAIALLGLPNVINLIQAILVKAEFDDAPALNEFWDSACDVAKVSQKLARRYTTLKTEDAFNAGMFHNIGVPIMLSNFTDYSEFMYQHGHRSAKEICKLERHIFNTDHYLQGALLAHEWQLGYHIATAIRYQPITQSILTSDKPIEADIRTILAILVLAKDISGEHHHYWKASNNDVNNDCVQVALAYLNIKEREFDELKEDTISDLIQEQVA